MLLDNVVFTRSAAAHLPDKPLIAFYDTHWRKGVDGILLCRHHTAGIKLHTCCILLAVCLSVTPFRTTLSGRDYLMIFLTHLIDTF